MRKKLISVCAAAVLMSPCAVLADVEEVKLAGNTCMVSGTASNGDTVSVLLTKSKSDADNVDNAVNFYSADVKNGAFDLKLPISEEKMGDSSDLTVYVRVGEGERKEYNLTYYPESDLNATVEKLKATNSADEMKKVLDSAENKELLTALGFDLDAWDESDKDNAAKVFYNNKSVLDKTYTEIAEGFETAVLLSSYEKGDAVAITDKLNKISEIKYESITYSDAVQKVDAEDICDYLKENAPYASFEDLNEEFAKACAFIDMKAAGTYGKLELVVDEYEDVLNMSAESYYSYYKSNKTNVAKKLISLISKNEINSEADFHELMETAVEEVKDSKTTTNKGSSSGGGGGGGGSSYAAPIIAPVVDNSVDKSDDNTVSESVTQSFTDLAASHWSFNAVEALHKAGVISGYGDDTFKPDNKVTREEFVTMLLNALEIQCTGGSTPFRDVENGKWYSTYVATAYLKELVSGIDRNEFGLGKEITRQDIAAILLRARTVYPEAAREYTGFADDADVSDYAKEAVKTMYEQGVISGSDGYFNPKASASRAETAMMIYNFINLPEVQTAE